jgi:C4-type Zn-finger protein
MGIPATIRCPACDKDATISLRWSETAVPPSAVLYVHMQCACGLRMQAAGCSSVGRIQAEQDALEDLRRAWRTQKEQRERHGPH